MSSVIIATIFFVIGVLFSMLISKSKKTESDPPFINSKYAPTSTTATSQPKDDLTSKMHTLLNVLIEGIIVLDQRRIILFANQAARTIFPTQLSSTPQTIIELTHSTKIDALIDQAIESKQTISEEFEINFPKHATILVRCALTHSSTTPLIVLTIQDLTSVARLERTRREFVANVSHELKTPLTSIKGFTETLLSGALKDPEKSFQFLKMMQEDIVRLERLIIDLLDLSKIESDRSPKSLEEFDLLELIAEVSSMFDHALTQKGVTIHNQIEPKINLSLNSDRDHVKQVLINLIDNAIKFNRDGGTITISTQKLENNFIQIEITDTGIGIPKDSVPRIFERFYRVDEARTRTLGGTGLGLSIVKHIIESLGGTVSCQSELDQGSTFRVILPILSA